MSVQRAGRGRGCHRGTQAAKGRPGHGGAHVDGEEGRSQGGALPKALKRKPPLPEAGGAGEAFVLLLLEGAVSSLRALPRAGTPSRVQPGRGGPLAGRAGCGDPLAGQAGRGGRLLQSGHLCSSFPGFLLRAPGYIRLPPWDASQGPWPPKPTLSSSTSPLSTQQPPVPELRGRLCPSLPGLGGPGVLSPSPHVACGLHSHSWHSLPLLGAHSNVSDHVEVCVRSATPWEWPSERPVDWASLARPCRLDSDAESA